MIRGKVVMTILLLINIDFTWIAAVQHRIHFFNELDTLLRDHYKYVQCSLLCLAEGISVIVPQIFKTVSTTLLHTLQNPTAPAPSLQKPILPTPSPYTDLSMLENSTLCHLSLLLDLQTNSLIRSRLLSTPTIQAISNLLDVTSASNFRGSTQFLNGLLIFCEGLAVE